MIILVQYVYDSRGVENYRMEYIVDMQGFKQSTNDYVLKELAILPLEKDSEPLVFLFQEPYN